MVSLYKRTTVRCCLSVLHDLIGRKFSRIFITSFFWVVIQSEENISSLASTRNGLELG